MTAFNYQSPLALLQQQEQEQKRREFALLEQQRQMQYSTTPEMANVTRYANVGVGALGTDPELLR